MQHGKKKEKLLGHLLKLEKLWLEALQMYVKFKNNWLAF